MTIHYKAVRLDRTSHYDRETKWRKGSTVRVEHPDPPRRGPCGRGIHSSASLLDAVGYQVGPSIYACVEPLDEIASDSTKTRSSAVRVVSWLTREETDEIAGFKLCEANHPVNPLHQRRDYSLNVPELTGAWDSVRASVRGLVRDSVRASVWAYTGGLFHKIERWKHAEALGPDPWRPLLTLWYGGYMPSFDGETWRVYTGRNAKVVYEVKA